MAEFEAPALAQKYKICVLGDPSVGKTSILQRFLEDEFSKTYQPTVGSDLYTKSVNLVSHPNNNGTKKAPATTTTTKMRLQIWDTAGDLRFRDLVPSHIKDSAVALIVYDVCNEESFRNACEFWFPTVRRLQRDCIIVLVGNKADVGLFQGRQVSIEETHEFAQSKGFHFLEVSACAGYNVRYLFRKVCAALKHSKQELDFSQRSAGNSDYAA